MDKSELIAEFKSQLEHFEKYQTFIDKARGYAERFNPAVVEKVIADNTERIRDVASILDPLVGDMRAVVSKLESERKGELDGAEAARLQLEELELRLAIGEMDDDSFQSASSGLQGTLAATAERVAAIGAEVDDFTATLGRWLDRRPDLAEPADVPLEEDPDEGDGSVVLDSDGDDEVLLGSTDDDARGDGVHAETPHVADDVSVVFDPPREASQSQPVISAPEEAAPALELGGAVSHEEGVGRPVLILAEGTSDEVVNHFDGDALSVGRGRDNNVQVKNDSKVSRYHCRLYRKGMSYFIVDNKSANGTVVEGDLITEKRLFGGEEIIIGETPFRFRILH